MDSRLLYFLCLSIITTGWAQSCTRSLPTYNESSFKGGNFSTGGVQLIIPSWNFSCQGTIEEWSAHVIGNTSVSDLIEFQVFEPDGGSYKIKYGNSYQGNSAQGSVITREVDVTDGPFIPIRPGDVVGVYLPPSSVDKLGLLYEDDGDTDVYYWENVEDRTCTYSLCSGKVIRDVELLVGWEFVVQSVSSLETLLALVRDEDPSYCQESILHCMTESSVTTTATSQILFQTPVPPSSLLSSSPLQTVAHSVTVSTTIATTTGDQTSTSISSSSTEVRSTSPTPKSNPSQGVAPELIAAFSVVFLLFLIVLLLIIAIGVCCCLRRKPVIDRSSAVAQGFDNPDYNGVISSEKQPMELTSFADDNVFSTPTSPNPLPLNTQTVATGSSPTPQFDDNHYYSPTGLQNSIEQQQRTRYDKPTHTSSSSHSESMNVKPQAVGNSNSVLPPPSIVLSEENHYQLPERNNDNSILSPTDSLASKSHYYSSPTTDVSNLSFPMVGGIYDTIDEDQNEVPSSQDPELAPGYDQIEVLAADDKKVSTVQAGKPSRESMNAYVYVPTTEQRKVLDWRYELPLDMAYNKLAFFEEQNQFWAPASTTSGLYQQLATNKYREIPREKILITNGLGQGQFGSVSKGIWTSPDGRHEVAIKMLKSDATEDDRLKLLQEAAIMGQFSNKNVVRVQGVVTLGDPIMLVLEYMPRGDLRSYLRSIKPKQGRWHPPPNLPKLLLRFCRDIARGMRYLAGKSFVHRDLAARNVLLSRELACKIGDFGMARDLMQDESNYYTSSGGIIPIKWTAPEALNFRKYSTDSDVWSYGMVLFEIWSLGHKPFSELSNPIVIALINSKHCQAPPPGCPRPLYKLMVECWHPEHSKRPPFSTIVTHLDSSSDSLLGWNREDTIRGRNAHILGAPLVESGDLYVDLQRIYQQSMLQNYNGRQRSKSNY